MSDVTSDIAACMRADWNRRAEEDARFFIAFGRRQQDDAEFAATATDVLVRIRQEFARLPPHMSASARRFLEIGCGIGRLMAPLSAFCGEIHGVDISDEMIRRGRARLADIAHAHLHWAAHSDLRAFADASFDFVYSFAVLQHLPDEAPFWRYLREAARVLKPGGVLLAQFNSDLAGRIAPDTWAGIVVDPARVLAACTGLDLQATTLEGAGTQYTWLTALRRTAPAAARPPATPFRIALVGNDSQVTAGGPDGFAQLHVEQLAPEYCDLAGLAGMLADQPLRVTRVESLRATGLREVVLAIPAAVAPGPQSLHLTWHGEPLTAPVGITVTAFARPPARLLRVTDGLDLLAEDLVSCGVGKLWIADLPDPAALRVTIGGHATPQLEFHCDDHVALRYQVNVTIPAALPPGRHALEVMCGATMIDRHEIEIRTG